MFRDYIDNLCRKIGLKDDVTTAISSLLDKKEMMLESLSSQVYLNENFKVLYDEMKHFGKGKASLLALCTILAMTEKTFQKYQEMGISEQVFYDTMSDITIWSENAQNETGIIGIENINWIINHLRANIFRLGRLQFQITHAHLPPYCSFRERIKSPIHTGDRIVFVHIPQGEKLTPEECDNSFKLAREFFDKYFPKFKFKYFVTESWLIYPEIKNVVSNNSNILSFQRRFRIIAMSNHSSQPYERIWGEKQKNVDYYSEETSLQQNAKKYLKNHGKLGVAYGYIEK